MSDTMANELLPAENPGSLPERLRRLADFLGAFPATGMIDAREVSVLLGEMVSVTAAAMNTATRLRTENAALRQSNAALGFLASAGAARMTGQA